MTKFLCSLTGMYGGSNGILCGLLLNHALEIYLALTNIASNGTMCMCNFCKPKRFAGLDYIHLVHQRFAASQMRGVGYYV